MCAARVSIRVTRRGHSPACVFLLCTTWIGCGSPPVADVRAAEPIVVTKFDPTIDFGSFSTFAVAPTVSLISDVSDAGTVPQGDSQEVVDRIAANMIARGYQQVAPTARPDLGLVASALVRLQAVTAVTPGYWWGSPGYAAPPATWGFAGGSYAPGWGYGSTAYFKSGTLVVDMHDLRDVGSSRVLDAGRGLDASGPLIEGVWVGIGHGFVGLDGSFGLDAAFAIDQAFLQSPYLRAR